METAFFKILELENIGRKKKQKNQFRLNVKRLRVRLNEGLNAEYETLVCAPHQETT